MDLDSWIESNRSMFIELSNEVWGYAELGYKEFQSSKTLEDTLKETGFNWNAVWLVFPLLSFQGNST